MTLCGAIANAPDGRCRRPWIRPRWPPRMRPRREHGLPEGPGPRGPGREGEDADAGHVSAAADRPCASTRRSPGVPREGPGDLANVLVEADAGRGLHPRLRPSLSWSRT